MKHPRELLLERHRHAGPELDAIRRSVIARECEADVRRPGQPADRWMTQLWAELVRPCRHAWTGLAAAWVLILGLNLTQTQPGNGDRSSPTPAVASVQSLLAEQALLRAELLGLNPVPGPPREAQRDENGPGPRSERPGKVNPPRGTGSTARALFAYPGPGSHAREGLAHGKDSGVLKVKGDV